MAEKEETFILVSLKEDRAKKLAQVISNESCRKILDFLAKKKATESEIAKELELPISTVHYNLKHLVNNNLVQVKEFHYSKKGKEVNHYSLTNKLVIIAPESARENFLEKLKNFLPALGIVLIIGLIARFWSKITGITRIGNFEAAKTAVQEEAMMDTGRIAEATVQTAPPPQVIAEPTFSFWWFVLGAVLVIAFYFLIAYLRKKLKK